MITIFVLLGLSFLVGGVGAIVDGWPYLVLERGFTQVIIGTVAATGGVILLGLAWLLIELRRVRTELRAMSLLSAVGLQGEPAPRAAIEEERAPTFPEPPPSESRLPGLGTVAAGAGLAAAGGALATAMAERGIARREDEPSTAEPVSPTRDEPEPQAPEPVAKDIFDEALLDVAATKGTGDEALSHAASHPGREPAAHEPLPEPEPEPEPEAEPEPIAAEPQRDKAPEDDIFAAIAADHALPTEREHEIPAQEREPELQVEPVPTVEPVEPPPVAAPEPRRSWWPRFGAGRTSEATSERAGGEADDLASLRQHLTLGPKPPLKSAEPEDTVEEQREAEPAAPEAWAPPPVFGRREPTFDEPSEQEMPQSEPEDEAGSEDAPTEEAAQADEPTAEAADEVVADEAETAVEAPQPAEPPRPAASDEGVVGAYQVGDTHFTMYADGSIKARTPDGEYSFASMDELKTYLASEKSRLGS